MLHILSIISVEWCNDHYFLTRYFFSKEGFCQEGFNEAPIKELFFLKALLCTFYLSLEVLPEYKTDILSVRKTIKEEVPVDYLSI